MGSFMRAFSSSLLSIVFGILCSADGGYLVMVKAVLWRMTHGHCIVAECILFIVGWAIHKSERKKCKPLGSVFLCGGIEGGNFHSFGKLFRSASGGKEWNLIVTDLKMNAISHVLPNRYWLWKTLNIWPWGISFRGILDARATGKPLNMVIPPASYQMLLANPWLESIYF